MLILTKNRITLTFLLFTFHLAQAQQSPLTAGGVATGSAGSVSYSIGQLIDDSYTKSNYTIAAGVQQPYEISNPLPLQWLLVTAQLQNNHAIISWKTVHEQEVNHFEVEKKTPTTDNFSFLASVEANNTNATPTYQYHDHQIAEGVSYYRVKEIDNNGAANYSQVVFINLQTKLSASIKVYPNPVVTQMNIVVNATENKTYSLVLVDATGRTVISKQVVCTQGSNTILWNVAQLAAGVYTVKAVGTDLAPVNVVK